MLQLFPQIKKRMMLVCGGYLALVIILCLLQPNRNWAVFGVLAVIGLLILLAAQYMNAVNAHNQLLNRLYNQLDVEGFLRDYEPLLNVPVRSPNLYLMVRLHISNAYCAQGRFDDAIRLLSSTEVRQAKPEQMLVTRFALASNLCYCAEQQDDIETAKTYLEQLRSYKKQLDDIQAQKPEKKRMVFNTELNEQCMKFLTTGKADIDVLKTQVQQNNTQQLHRITTSLWIARADLAANNRREAESILNQIIKLSPDLYPGKVAKKLLDELPPKPEEKEEKKDAKKDNRSGKKAKS